MNRVNFLTIAHTNHTFCSPISEDKAELLALLEPIPFYPILDVGCGKGEFLIRLCARYNVCGVGVDTNNTFLQTAREQAQLRLPSEQITFIEAAIVDYQPEYLFSGVLCIGATHAYGSYRATLQACSRLVVSGGFVLIAEGYWKREPSSEYLDFLGASSSIYTTHANNVQLGVEFGFIPLYSTVSDNSEWDYYEGLYNPAVEQYIFTHSNDPDAAAMRQNILQRYEMYLQQGRDTRLFWILLVYETIIKILKFSLPLLLKQALS
ncbi:SAM-dependent methyltransferase [Rivularia sp. IAM M-261]|nr:SAM-dependent methyltransferase [Calothrix sp. PCC 7716]GJD19019.1 SAM-dependent methyltransferase [Rivularia sp. IAM M-261]